MSYGKIAIIVPVYNCEKYLKECIESILKQTYSDFELFIIDDESRDKSPEIALEYVKKDPRITLICKQNKGQGAARNAALAYLFKDFELEKANSNVESQKDSALYRYKITKNPKNLSFISEIKALYSAKNLQNQSEFAFVQFVDSDDFLDLRCIQQSLEEIGQSDILWFDYEPFFDGVKKRKFHRQMHEFAYFHNEKINIFSLLDRAKERKIPTLWFACQGVLRFDLLYKNRLYFLNEHYAEDVDFAVRAFSLAKSIQIYSKSLYHYRIRPGSSMNFKPKKTSLPLYLKELEEAFEGDLRKAKDYQKAMSLVNVALSLIEFFNNLEDKTLANRLEKQFLPFLCNKALMIEFFEKDPKNMRVKLAPLKALVKKQPKGAMKHTKNYLRYKLLKTASKSSSLLKIFKLCKVLYTYQKEQRAYKKAIKKNISLKKIRVELYSDYINSRRLNKALSLRKLLKLK